MKKLIAMLLTLALVASLGVTAFAGNGTGTLVATGTNWRWDLTVDELIASLNTKADYVKKADALGTEFLKQINALDQKWSGIAGYEKNAEYKAQMEALEAVYAAAFVALGKEADVQNVNYGEYQKFFNFGFYQHDWFDFDGKTGRYEEEYGTEAPFADLLKQAKDIKADNDFSKLFPKGATTGDILAYIAGKTVVPTEEPATEEPATEEPATEEPATEEPATEEPATEEPAPVDPKLAAILKVRSEVTAKIDASKDGKAAADLLKKEADYNKAAAQAFVADAKKAANDAKAAIDTARKGAVAEAQAAILNAQANAYATLAKGISDAVTEYVAAVDTEIVNFYNSINAPAAVYDYSNYPG